jgi:CBS domain-containing protein
MLTRRGRAVQARGEATTADRLMSTELVTVTPDTGIARAAYLMERHAVTHLPVVDQRNIVVGIVSRSDLLRAYLREGREIRREVEQALRSSLPDDDLETVRVHIEDGIITLSGTVDRRFAAHAVLHHLRAIRGVVDVVDAMEAREREAVGDEPVSPGPLF